MPLTSPIAYTPSTFVRIISSTTIAPLSSLSARLLKTDVLDIGLATSGDRKKHRLQPQSVCPFDVDRQRDTLISNSQSSAFGRTPSCIDVWRLYCLVNSWIWASWLGRHCRRGDVGAIAMVDGGPLDSGGAATATIMRFGSFSSTTAWSELITTLPSCGTPSIARAVGNQC